MSSLPVHPSAVPVAVTTPDITPVPVLLCPVCGVAWRDPSSGSGYEPVCYVGCGHCVCGACAKAGRDAPEPVCPVCYKNGREEWLNGRLGEFSEGVLLNRVVALPSCVPIQFCVDCRSSLEEDIPATMSCNGPPCKSRPLCDHHGQPHVKRGHSVVVFGGSVVKPPSSQNCPRHAGTPLKFYCNIHKASICAECVLRDHPEGSPEHEVVSLEVVAGPAADKLRQLSSACHDHAKSALSWAATVEETRVGLLSKRSDELSSLSELWDGVKGELDGVYDRVVKASESAFERKMKQLEAQHDELMVRSGQLEAGHCLSENGLLSGNLCELVSSCESVEKMSVMMGSVFEGPCVREGVSVSFDVVGLKRDVMKRAVLKRFSVGVGVGLSELSGVGLSGYVSGDVSGNVIELLVRDEDGRVCVELSVDDVVFDALAVDGVSGSVLGDGVSVLSRCEKTLIGVGCVRIVYDVYDVAAAGLLIEVCGVCLSGDGGVGSRHSVVRGTCVKDRALAEEKRLNSELMARTQQQAAALEECKKEIVTLSASLEVYHKAESDAKAAAEAEAKRLAEEEAAKKRDLQLNRHVKTIPIATSSCCAMAVNSNETLMAVASTGGTDADKMFLYSLPAGTLLKTIGGYGSAPGQFSNPYRLCFGSDDSVIVADCQNHRLQEFTSTGEYKRSIAVRYPEDVCCNGRMLAVVSCSPHEITLFDYASGVELRKFGSSVARQCCNSLRFTADGTGLITPTNNSVSLFSVADGSLVRTMCEDVFTAGQFKGVELAPNGEIIVADYSTHRILIFDADGSRLVRSFGSEGTGDGQFKYPTALSLVNGRLYVMDYRTPRVQVFE